MVDPGKRKKNRFKTTAVRIVTALALCTILFALPAPAARPLRVNESVGQKNEIPYEKESRSAPTVETLKPEIVAEPEQNMAVVVEENTFVGKISRQKLNSNTDGKLEYDANGIARSSQFPEYHVVDKSRQANIAFFFQITESSIPFLPRLIDRLWHERNVLLIHVDAKCSDEVLKQFKQRYQALDKYSNMHFLHRESVTYAGGSMLLNTLSAMEYLLNLEQPWDYFINLSGADYPTVSVHNMRILLGQPRVLQQQVSFLQFSHDKAFWEKMKKFRFDKMYADPILGRPYQDSSANELIPTYRNRPLYDKMGLDFVQHEAWIIAHRKLVHASVRSSFSRRLIMLLGTAKDPEEHFFGMLSWHTPELNRTTARYAGRGVFWHLDGVKSGQHPFIVDREDEMPNGVPQYDRFWRPIRNKPLFFVRKFSRPDSKLMDMIDEFKSGINQETAIETVKNSLRTLQYMMMCHADVEKNWYNPKLVPCFKEWQPDTIHKQM